MVPLIELRAGVPIAVGMDLGLPEWLVLIIAIIGRRFDLCNLSARGAVFNAF